MITIDWATRIISVPKLDTTLVQAPPQEIRELDVNVLRLRLKDLEDDEEGMPFIRTHNHNPEVVVAGVTLARVVELINGYTVTFEETTWTNQNSAPGADRSTPTGTASAAAVAPASAATDRQEGLW